MTPSPLGFILIVGRNNLHLTRAAVNSALAQDVPCVTMLVENASADNTARYASAKDGIVYVASDRQRSLSTCWNSGLKAAWDTGHTSALVLNNDIEIRPDTYRLLEAHGGEFVTCVSVDTRDRMAFPPTPTSESPHPDFSAFLIRKSVTDKVGWFDERCFPAYTEDSNYHVRMHRAGIRAVSIDLPFLHHASQTLKHSDPKDRAMIERGAHENRERFRKEFGCLPGSQAYNDLFRDEHFGSAISSQTTM